MASIESLKLQVEEAKFIKDDSIEAVTAWSKEWSKEIKKITWLKLTEITYLTKCLVGKPVRN